SIDREQGYFRGNAKPNREDARAYAGSYKKMFGAFDDMARRVALAEIRRHDWPSDDRQCDLTTVRGSCNCQRNSRGNGWENIGVMCESNDLGAGGNSCQR